MDTLHTVLRGIQSDAAQETKAKPDHLTVFREFLAHLDAIQRKAQVVTATKKPRAKSTRRKTKRAKET